MDFLPTAQHSCAEATGLYFLMTGLSVRAVHIMASLFYPFFDQMCIEHLSARHLGSNAGQKALPFSSRALGLESSVSALKGWLTTFMRTLALCPTTNHRFRKYLNDSKYSLKA